MITSDLYRYKDMNFPVKDKLRPKDIDALKDYEIRPTDVVIVTYPKSGELPPVRHLDRPKRPTAELVKADLGLLVGTVWMQQILSQIMEASHPGWSEHATNRTQIPYLEGRTADDPFQERKDPRVVRTHLLPELLPRGVHEKQVKVTSQPHPPPSLGRVMKQMCVKLTSPSGGVRPEEPQRRPGVPVSLRPQLGFAGSS